MVGPDRAVGICGGGMQFSAVWGERGGGGLAKRQKNAG